MTGGGFDRPAGGSFNPAHEGHLHLSDSAARQLGLDEVWWLVSPQNPLKQRDGMAPLRTRLDGHGIWQPHAGKSGDRAESGSGRRSPGRRCRRFAAAARSTGSAG